MMRAALCTVSVALMLSHARADSEALPFPVTDTGECVWNGALCGSYPCRSTDALPVLECVFGATFEGCPAGCEAKQLGSAMTASTASTICALEGYGDTPVTTEAIEAVNTHCAFIDVTDFDVSEDNECLTATLDLWRQLGCDTEECLTAIVANQHRTNRCLDATSAEECAATVAPCSVLDTYEAPDGLVDEGGEEPARPAARPAHGSGGYGYGYGE